MKICPKCNSKFTDETLNFCLVDGVLLLVEEKLTKPENWQEAETVFDADLKIHQFNAKDTSHNPVSETNTGFSGNTKSFTLKQTKKKRPYLFPLIGVLGVLLAVSGIFWWLYTNPGSPTNPANKINQTGHLNKKKIIIPLTPQQENQVKKETLEFIERWRSTNEKKDIESHIAHYSNTLEIYYGNSGVDKNIVRSDRLRAYQRYPSISISVDNINLRPESTDSVTIVFDKSWTMKSDQKTSTGSVQQELHISKTSNKWLVDGEKDLKVYYINNRENPVENTNTIQNKN